MQREIVPAQYSAPIWSEAVINWLSTVLEERYGLPIHLAFGGNTWRLTLPESGGSICMGADPAMFTRADSDLPFTVWDATNENWRSALGSPLPAPGLSVPPSPLAEKTDSGYSIHYDILGLAYWMLTRQEEVGRTDIDEHGRFPAKSSHAFKYGYLERPVVDEWLDVLGQVIQRSWPSVRLKQNQFSIKVSHDVDSPSRYGFIPWRKMLRPVAGDLLKHRDWRGLMAPWIRLNSRSRLHPRDPHNTFEWLMDISDQHDLTSAFYFICDRRGTPHDSNYDLGHPAIRALIRRIHERGHEIGLHPSYNTFRDSTQIVNEARRLRQICEEERVQQQAYGGRMHYLQWRQPETLRAWDSAEMAYDSTMAYADHVGFRCGTCFEYPSFDPVMQKAANLRIRPLIVMEGSVFGAKYMGLGVTQEAQDKMITLKQTCNALNGCLTLLWHNSSFRAACEFDMYRAVLSEKLV